MILLEKTVETVIAFDLGVDIGVLGQVTVASALTFLSLYLVTFDRGVCEV
jgi:hypothetical protein